MLQDGSAYVDKTPVDDMRRERMEGVGVVDMQSTGLTLEV
jgi:hypothetical protein